MGGLPPDVCCADGPHCEHTGEIDPIDAARERLARAALANGGFGGQTTVSADDLAAVLNAWPDRPEPDEDESDGIAHLRRELRDGMAVGMIYVRELLLAYDLVCTCYRFQRRRLREVLGMDEGTSFAAMMGVVRRLRAEAEPKFADASAEASYRRHVTGRPGEPAITIHKIHPPGREPIPAGTPVRVDWPERTREGNVRIILDDGYDFYADPDAVHRTPR